MLEFKNTQPRTVVGVLLNDRQAYRELESAMDAPPYNARPVAPVLYIKPANTYAADGDTILLPSDVSEIEVGPCLGVVIGRTATRVSCETAMEHVAGYRVVADLTVPHGNYFRPALKQRCRDGFCPISSVMTPADRVENPDQLSILVSVDGRKLLETTTDPIRPVARLIADISAFMTLEAGDIVLTGVPHGAPRARAGQRYEIIIPGVGSVSNSLQSA